MSAVNVALGARLRQLREARRLTVVEVAQRIEKHVSAIYNIEAGRHGATAVTLFALCDLYGAAIVIGGFTVKP